MEILKEFQIMLLSLALKEISRLKAIENDKFQCCQNFFIKIPYQMPKDSQIQSLTLTDFFVFFKPIATENSNIWLANIM